MVLWHLAKRWLGGHEARREALFWLHFRLIRRDKRDDLFGRWARASIISALRDKDAAVRSQAEQSVDVSWGEENLGAALHDPEGNIRPPVAKALKELKRVYALTPEQLRREMRQMQRERISKTLSDVVTTENLLRCQLSIWEITGLHERHKDDDVGWHWSGTVAQSSTGVDWKTIADEYGRFDRSLTAEDVKERIRAKLPWQFQLSPVEWTKTVDLLEGASYTARLSAGKPL